MSNPRYKSGIWLSKVVSWEVKEYIPEEGRRLIYDFKDLEELFKDIQDEVGLYDWSTIIAPVCKSVEAIMQKIADDCELNIKGSDKLGSFFDEANVDKHIDELVGKLSVNSSKKELKQTLSELKIFLRRYRHKPMHFSCRVENFFEAQAYGVSAICSIGNVVKVLFEYGIIEKPEKREPEVQPLDLSEIPF